MVTRYERTGITREVNVMDAAIFKAMLRRNNQVTIPKRITDIIGTPKRSILYLAFMGWWDDDGVFHKLDHPEKLEACDKCTVSRLSDEQKPKEETQN
jgi:hypothetical protein